MAWDNFEELKGLNMHAKLSTEFRNDPLYRIFVERDQEQNLFVDFILDLADTVMYSTAQVAEMFSSYFVENKRDPLPVGTLRNYIYALEDYIRPIGAGRLIKLNYESIFRLHMIFSLKDEYSVPMLQKKLLGNFKAEERGLVETNQVQLQQDVETLKQFIAALGKTGLIKMEGTDPSNYQVVLNPDIIQKQVERILSERYQPLLESQNDEMKHIQNELETTKEMLDETLIKNQELMRELQKNLEEKTEDRIRRTEQNLSLIQANMKLRREAAAAWKKLGILTKLKSSEEEFILNYIEEHSKEED